MSGALLCCGFRCAAFIKPSPYMNTTITAVDLHVPPPVKLPPALQKHDGASQAVAPEQREHQKLDLVSSVAEHFTAEEKSAASVWLSQHPEVRIADNGPRVFTDPFSAKVYRELELIADRGKGWGPETFDASSARPDEDDGKEASNELLLDSSAKGIHARIEAASVVRNGQEEADHSIERFMADADERLEPYFAFRDGMSLSRIATTYGIANIRLLLDKVEQVLNQLERE